MDPATAIGIGVGAVIIVVSNIMEGGNPAALLLPAPMILVFGASILASVAGGTMADAKAAAVSLKTAFTTKPQPSNELVPVLVTLAERARREGLLALESASRDLDDDYLKRGITLTVDGTDPEEARDILESEIFAKQRSTKQEAKFFNDLGAYAPTFGIVGTVMGLVHVLESLSNPDELGHLIAAAFVATLWGVLSANLIFLPIGNRIKRLGDLEVARMEIIVEGVMAIQAGANPRVVAQKLRSLIPADEREVEAA
ncbi:motility protein A [Solicola sp. PLA-1-18]|uniref:motility protein A n=1 Tax=Solicola sp. PLA-1-18 TaxID=3380532 RepID=UPI003B8063F6